MRNLVALFSIACILLCPYQCAVKWAAAQGINNNEKPACCDECQASRTAAPLRQRVPEGPASDQEGRACLCAGAVFDAEARLLPDDNASILLDTWSDRPATTLKIAVATTTYDPTSSPPPLDGRLTRIAMRSLLL